MAQCSLILDSCSPAMLYIPIQYLNNAASEMALKKSKSSKAPTRKGKTMLRGGGTRGLDKSFLNGSRMDAFSSHGQKTPMGNKRH
eukprot:scaffold459719_cov36-Prasinocladus_malaysianus.AAC.1